MSGAIANSYRFAETVDDEKIIVPETVDQLLDICANIARNVKATWEGEALAWMFPPGNVHQGGDCVIFNNAGDMPFAVWTGKAAKSIFRSPETKGYQYAYRIGRQELVLRFPVLNSRGGDGYWSPLAAWNWVPVRGDLEFNRPVTQFLGKRVIE